MTESNPTATETIAALVDDIVKRLVSEGAYTVTQLRAALLQLTRDAYELGRLAEAPTAPPRASARDTFGARTGAPTEGLAVHVVHGIKAEDYARDGELCLLAWVQQTFREVAQNGADPAKQLTLDLATLENGNILLTAEAAL